MRVKVEVKKSKKASCVLHSELSFQTLQQADGL